VKEVELRRKRLKERGNGREGKVGNMLYYIWGHRQRRPSCCSRLLKDRFREYFNCVNKLSTYPPAKQAIVFSSTLFFQCVSVNGITENTVKKFS